MASKSNFIGQFRQAVQTMQTEYDKALDLVQFAKALGWDSLALQGEFTASDITVEDFMAAMATVEAIEGANAGIAGTLSKMHS